MVGWATSPLPSRGPRRGRDSYVTRACSGVANAKRGDEIRTGYLTPAFLGAQKRAEVLRKPCILRVPKANQGEKIRCVGLGRGSHRRRVPTAGVFFPHRHNWALPRLSGLTALQGGYSGGWGVPLCDIPSGFCFCVCPPRPRAPQPPR